MPLSSKPASTSRAYMNRGLQALSGNRTCGSCFKVYEIGSLIWGVRFCCAVVSASSFTYRGNLWEPGSDTAIATGDLVIPGGSGAGVYDIEFDTPYVFTASDLVKQKDFGAATLTAVNSFAVSVWETSGTWYSRFWVSAVFATGDIRGAGFHYGGHGDVFHSLSTTAPVKPVTAEGPRYMIDPIIYVNSDASDTTGPSFDPTPIDEATGIAIDSDLVVDITDNDSGVLASTVTISVTTPDAITTIWTAGSATGGWSGSVSAIGDGYQYTLTPPSPFDYLEDISWSAYAEDEAANSSSDTWSFTTAPSPELIPPVIGHIFNLTSIQTVGTVSVVGGTSIGAGIDLTSDIEGRAIPSINVVHYWNQFDDHAAILSLQRKKGEKNWELGRRTRDAATNLANSSYHGLVNGITQGLGLSLFKSMCITPKVGYNGDYLAADPYILFSGPYLYLYSDYANDELEYQIDRYEPGGNYEYLRPLIDFVNTSTYFTARLWPGIDEFTRSMTVLNQSNRESMTYELVPKSTRFRLRKARIVRGSVFFSDRNLFRDEVLLEELVDTRGKYYINYSKGIVTVYTVPSGNITVRYQYNQEPFCAKASPVILHDINSLFREKLFQQVLLNDGTYTDGIPTELGVDIINEILSVVPMYWGV